MKTLFLLAVAILISSALLVPSILAEDVRKIQSHEYATIRWGGLDNTHIIRPGGRVEFVGAELRKVVRPNRTDDRSFYMNLVMNGLAKEGYRFVGMTPDEIVMEREIK